MNIKFIFQKIILLMKNMKRISNFSLELNAAISRKKIASKYAIQSCNNLARKIEVNKKPRVRR